MCVYICIYIYIYNIYIVCVYIIYILQDTWLFKLFNSVTASCDLLTVCMRK